MNLWRSSMMQPAKASQKSPQSFRTKSNSSTATEPSSASAIPHRLALSNRLQRMYARTLFDKADKYMYETSSRASRDAKTKETPETGNILSPVLAFFVVFSLVFANASICAYPAENQWFLPQLFLTASRPS